MRIIVDADGCPVVDETIAVAARFGIEVVLVCDTSHIFERAGASTVTVSKGADSADLAVANMLAPFDIAVTQDYGLAALCLARRARALNQDGMLYTNENIDALLSQRHFSKKLRAGGVRIKGASKRQKQQDEDFTRTLTKLLEESL